MQSKVIKSRRANDALIKLFELSDDQNGIIGYSVVKVYQGIDVSSGAAKIEETPLLSEEEAVNFFNDQN